MCKPNFQKTKIAMAMALDFNEEIVLVIVAQEIPYLACRHSFSAYTYTWVSCYEQLRTSALCVFSANIFS